MYIEEPGNPLKDRAHSTLYTIEEKAEGVRPHFRALSQLKVIKAGEEKSKNDQFNKFYKKASLYSLNNDTDAKTSIIAIADNIL